MYSTILSYLLAVLISVSGAFSYLSGIGLEPPISGPTTDAGLYSEHHAVTQELINMLEHDPQLKSLMKKSIEKARMVNPDPMTNPVQSLEAYYDFIDWSMTALPWAILPGVEEQYPYLYDQIDQSLNYFYYLNDQPLEELEDLGLYHNSIQYYGGYRSWLIDYTSKYGQFLNTRESWNQKYLQKVQADPHFHMQDLSEYEDPSHWRTFNQFFARYLSSPEVRPIADPENAAVVISPADSVPQGIWHINANGRLEDNEKVTVKSGLLSSVDVLLGNSEYRGAFAGGTMTHTFLNVNDYHRFHFPVSGTIKEVQLIAQDDAVGGIVQWNPQAQRYVLLCEEPGWQMVETRACVIMETEKCGLVAIIPVGMSQVSSVCLEDTVYPGNYVEKGDMMGCFLFGGSDIIMLFQEQAEFSLTTPTYAGGTYAHIRMGEEYGTFKIKPEEESSEEESSEEESSEEESSEEESSEEESYAEESSEEESYVEESSEEESYVEESSEEESYAEESSEEESYVEESSEEESYAEESSEEESYVEESSEEESYEEESSEYFHEGEFAWLLAFVADEYYRGSQYANLAKDDIVSFTYVNNDLVVSLYELIDLKKISPQNIEEDGGLPLEAVTYGLFIADKFTLLDAYGDVLEDQDLTRFFDFHDGLAPIRVFDHDGYINEEGILVIPAMFVDAWSFEDGTAEVFTEEGSAFLDIYGNYTIWPSNEYLYWTSEGYAVFSGNNGYNIIDRHSGEKIGMTYDYTDGIHEGLANVAMDDLWGYVDRSGAFVLEPTYSYTGKFSEDRSSVLTENLFGYVDATFNFVIEPQFDQAKDFSEDAAAVCKEGQWFYIDRWGNMLFDMRFEQAESFKEDRAAVKVDGKWGFIDHSGKFVLPPIYDSVYEYIAPAYYDGVVHLMLNGREVMCDLEGYNDEENPERFGYWTDYDNGFWLVAPFGEQFDISLDTLILRALA